MGDIDRAENIFIDDADMLARPKQVRDFFEKTIPLAVWHRSGCAPNFINVID